MSIQTFADRFIYGTSITLDTVINTPDAELPILLPTLNSYAEQVYTHSIFLSNNRFDYKYIYDICTKDSDARISLVLASAKDLSNKPLFPNLEVIKELMFGPTSLDPTLFNRDEYNIFVNGITRISTALTAAKLLAQLSQIEEQFKHANALERQALADLDRLLKLNSIKDLGTNGVSSAATAYSASMYFEIINFTLNNNESLKCEVYMPSVNYDSLLTRTTVNNSLWITAFEWNTNAVYSTNDIVLIISDTINSLTLNNRTTNILAAPMLNNANSRNEIVFDSRLKSNILAAEIVCIRFTYTNNLTNTSLELPFRWGNNSIILNRGKVNSILLAIQNGKVASTVDSSSTQTPVVLYIKRGPVNSNNEPLNWQGNIIQISEYNPTANLTLRLSTDMNTSITTAVPYILSSNTLNQVYLDKERPAQVANIIINELYKVKNDTRTLGTLFRSDSPDSIDPVSAIELTCFTARNPDTWTILDILDLPPDIYVATGDLKGPITPYSNNPRAIRVNTLFVSNKILSGNVNPSAGESSAPGFVSIKRSKAMTDINDRINRNRFL